MHTLPLNLIALTIYIPLLFTAAWVRSLAYHGNWDHLYWTAACTCQCFVQSVLSVAAHPSDSLHIAVCHFSICTFTYQPLNLSASFFCSLCPHRHPIYPLQSLGLHLVAIEIQTLVPSFPEYDFSNRSNLYCSAPSPIIFLPLMILLSNL
jgi:hypothetical protein